MSVKFVFLLAYGLGLFMGFLIAYFCYWIRKE